MAALPATATSAEVVTRYEISRQQAGKTEVIGYYDYVRAGRSIAMRDSRNGFWDVWQRADDGRVGLERVVPALSSFVEIESGELAARNLTVDWDVLQQPFAPSVIDKCRSGEADSNFRCETDWSGDIKALRFLSEQTIEEWKAVDVSDSDRLSLISMLSMPQGYQRWDAADFGDQESLPALREFQKAARLEALLGAHQDHAH